VKLERAVNMKVELDIEKRKLRVTKEKGDMRIINESHLMYRILQSLKSQGYDVIKKRMWKDGHMVSDSIQYIRTRKPKPYDFAIWDDQYAIRDSAKGYETDGCINNLRLVIPYFKEEAQSNE
jgi:hypothetical protein